MTRPLSESLWEAYHAALIELARVRSDVIVVEPSGSDETWPGPLERALADRVTRVDDPSPDAIVRTGASLATGDRTVFLSTRARAVVQAYGAIRHAIGQSRANVKLVARFPWPATVANDGIASAVEEVGLMRGIPGMTVVVPADAPTTRSAIHAVAGFQGPAYLRLAEGIHPTLTEGTFTPGRANTLRDGTDLTVAAAGPILGAALALAEEFHQVGVGVRVLDLASVKPIDAPALLRAARETGAILVVEEHTVETGLGELVAATVAENFPVPLRRVGVPDLFEALPGTHGNLGPAADRMRDEAWELLRLRGKVQ